MRWIEAKFFSKKSALFLVGIMIDAWTMGITLPSFGEQAEHEGAEKGLQAEYNEGEP
jgi:hypothetical protein